VADPCAKCGSPAAPIELAQNGEVIAVGSVCAPCLDIAHGADFLRERFDELLVDGMSRERANEVMCRWWVPEVLARGDQERAEVARG
jgi:hypothetical protein